MILGNESPVTSALLLSMICLPFFTNGTPHFHFVRNFFSRAFAGHFLHHGSELVSLWRSFRAIFLFFPWK
jgi:hypothetical protein